MAKSTIRRRTAPAAKDSALVVNLRRELEDLQRWLGSAPPLALQTIRDVGAAAGAIVHEIPKARPNEIAAAAAEGPSTLEAGRSAFVRAGLARAWGLDRAAVWLEVVATAALASRGVTVLRREIAGGVKSRRCAPEGREKPREVKAAAVALSERLRAQGMKAEAAAREVQKQHDVSPAALKRYTRAMKKNRGSIGG